MESLNHFATNCCAISGCWIDEGSNSLASQGSCTGGVARYLYRPPLTREACAESVAVRAGGTSWKADGDVLLLAVCRADEPAVVGEVVLTLSSAAARQAEIGWIFNPRYAGQGYATEAARALLSLAFGRLRAHRVFARLDDLNTVSVRVCERLGMRREAHLIDNDLGGERWGSEYIYTMLAHEWKEGTPAGDREN